MTTSLDCRLLCASMTADAVTSNGPLTQKPAPYYSAAQFVDDPPVGFVGGTQSINACLVGTTSDGVILAFRGHVATATRPRAGDSRLDQRPGR